MGNNTGNDKSILEKIADGIKDIAAIATNAANDALKPAPASKADEPIASYMPLAAEGLVSDPMLVPPIAVAPARKKRRAATGRTTAPARGQTTKAASKKSAGQAARKVAKKAAAKSSKTAKKTTKKVVKNAVGKADKKAAKKTASKTKKSAAKKPVMKARKSRRRTKA
jgi:hypothetical protein